MTTVCEHVKDQDERKTFPKGYQLKFKVCKLLITIFFFPESQAMASFQRVVTEIMLEGALGFFLHHEAVKWDVKSKSINSIKPQPET